MADVENQEAPAVDIQGIRECWQITLTDTV